MRIGPLAFAVGALLCTPAAAYAQTTPVYVLPPANVSDLKKALESASPVYTLTPQSEMPSYDPIAHYVPLGEDAKSPLPHILVGSNYAGLLDGAQSMALDARKALLSAAILDVADSGSAGPGFKMQYMLNADFDSHCTCNDPYFTRHKFAAEFVDQLLAERFVLRIPSGVN